MSTYLTDSWSTITGLASVAYGSPTRYPEVAGQVRRQSVTDFLGPMPPSEVISNRLSLADFSAAVSSEYGKDSRFKKFVESGSQTVEEIAKRVYEQTVQSFNEMGTYESSLSDAIEYAAVGLGIPINPQNVSKYLSANVSDLELFSTLAASVPHSKPDKLPAGTRIELDSGISLDLDHNGISFTTGYLTPNDYLTGVAYPGMGDTGDNLPDNIVKSLTEGYAGYPTLQPLDDLLRPGLAALMSLSDIRDLKGLARSIAGLGTIDTLKDLTGLGALSQADQAMYNIDLTDIVVGINGYTVYDPQTDSNGDFIDQTKVPSYESENADPGSGLPYSTRTRSNAF